MFDIVKVICSRLRFEHDIWECSLAIFFYTTTSIRRLILFDLHQKSRCCLQNNLDTTNIYQEMAVALFYFAKASLGQVAFISLQADMPKS